MPPATCNIYALGTLFVQLTLGMNAFITAQGFATTGMLTVLIGAVCNIVLDPLFIFGLHMGVRGAALATVLSQGVSCVWVVRFLMRQKDAPAAPVRRIMRLRHASSFCPVCRARPGHVHHAGTARASSPSASTPPCSNTAAISPSAP